MSHQIKYLARQFVIACLNRKRLAVSVSLLTLISVISSVQAANGLRLGSHEVQAPERILEVAEKEWPKDALELIEVNGWQSVDFPRGFEVKVRNISQKPIYFYHIAVVFPESRGIVDGGRMGNMLLMYGKPKFMDTSGGSGFPTSEDQPVKPGEIITLTPTDSVVNTFFNHLGPERKAMMMEKGIRRIRIVSQVINFGDGTGYLINKQTPVKKVALKADNKEGSFKLVNASYRFSTTSRLQGGGNCFNGGFATYTCYTTNSSCEASQTRPTDTQDPIAGWDEQDTSCGCMSYVSGTCI